VTSEDLPSTSLWLLSVALRPPGEAEVLHVNFWAVDGWFFNLNASRSLRQFRDLSDVVVEAVEHSYRSNLVRRGAWPAQAADKRDTAGGLSRASLGPKEILAGYKPRR